MLSEGEDLLHLVQLPRGWKVRTNGCWAEEILCSKKRFEGGRQAASLAFFRKMWRYFCSEHTRLWIEGVPLHVHSFLVWGEKINTGKYWELFARIFYWRWKDFSWMLLWGLNLPFLLWTSDRAVFKEIGTEFCPVSWAAELSPIYYSCKLGTLQSSRPANIGLWSRWGLPFYKDKGWSSNEVTVVVVLYSCSIRMRKAPLCTFSRETFLILMLSQKAETLTHTTRASMFRLLLQRGRAHRAGVMAAVWMHFQSADVARSSDLPPDCAWSFAAQPVTWLS